MCVKLVNYKFCKLRFLYYCVSCSDNKPTRTWTPAMIPFLSNKTAISFSFRSLYLKPEKRPSFSQEVLPASTQPCSTAVVTTRGRRLKKPMAGP